MSKTQSVFGTELKEKLLSGIKQLNQSVSTTLGPGGRTVLIREQNGEVKVTKDGVTVAKAFHRLEDDVEDLGAQLVKNVSIKSANEAGDGTTTSTLLAAKIVEEGIKAIRQGSNPIEVKRGMDKAVSVIVAKLKEWSVDITSEEQIKQVATISGNNDTEVGNLIAAAIEKVGREGVVTIEESKTGETSLEVVEGMQFDRGFKSPYFVTDNTTMMANLEDPYILLYDGRINNAQELLNVMQKANTDNKSLLVIAEDYGEEALALMIVNKMRGIVKVCAVKAPDFGDRKTLIMEDIAILTGGTVLSKDKGHKLDKLPVDQLIQSLGRARMVTVAKEETTIIDGKGDQDSIANRAQEIKEQIEKASSFFEKEKLQDRLGKLIGGVAIINVGGNSEIEIKEKKDRVEDALYATKAALLDGIVPGGGMALYRAADSADLTFDCSENEKLGVRIVKEACRAPFKTILSNAGVENWYEIVAKVEEASLDLSNVTYDAKNFKVVEALDAGIIDPTKVVVTAIKNASSVAGTILTTEAIVYEKKDDKDQSQMDPMMGMGGMM
jgi:chaperonin GroEL